MYVQQYKDSYRNCNNNLIKKIKIYLHPIRMQKILTKVIRAITKEVVTKHHLATSSQLQKSNGPIRQHLHPAVARLTKAIRTVTQEVTKKQCLIARNNHHCKKAAHLHLAVAVQAVAHLGQSQQSKIQMIYNPEHYEIIELQYMLADMSQGAVEKH